MQLSTTQQGGQKGRQTGQGQNTSDITAEQYELLKKIEAYLTNTELFPNPTLQGVKQIIKKGQQQVQKNKQQITASTKQGQQNKQ